MKITKLIANPKTYVAPILAGASAILMPLSSFASEGLQATTTTTLPTVGITADMLKPLVDGVVANVGVIVPVGIVLMGILMGVRLIPGLMSSFMKLK